MPQKETRLVHALGTPMEIPGPEAEQLIRLGLLHLDESFGPPTRPGPQRATANKRNKSSGASKRTAKKSRSQPTTD
jgi:hypothetical protein